MSYTPVPLSSFGAGLNLRDQPDVLDPSQALDLLNVDFSERGAIRSRPGWAKVTTAELTNQPDSMFTFYTSDGSKRLLVGNGNRVDALNTVPGSSSTNSSALTNTASPHFFTRFGGPTREAVYIANGADRLKRYVVGTGFTEPAGLSGIAPKFLAVQSPDNRLVAARFAGTTGVSNPSTVRFSNAGDPETFAANNYVQLDPGDGEEIMGVANWGNMTFVFKQTKTFAFYGNGVDGSGEPVFNFRKVSETVGLAASQAVVAARDGVYFLSRNGVYRTRGSEPEQVSDMIDPFFVGGASAYYQSDTLAMNLIGQSAMTFFEERIYLTVPTGGGATNDRVLVYDPRYRWWTLYDIPARAMCVFRAGETNELLFAIGDPVLGKHLARHGSAYSADNMATDASGGTAMVSRWRSGWLDFGNPEVKTVRQMRAWGEGRCAVKLTRDFLDAGQNTPVSFGSGTADLWGGGTGTDTWGGGAGTDTWGPVRQVQPRLVRQARRGTLFSLSFSHSTLNESWAIHRVDIQMRDQRVPGTIRSEVAA